MTGAVRSVAPHVDAVLVLDGPFGEPPTDGEQSQLEPRELGRNVIVRHGGPWKDDAAKRTDHAQWARAYAARSRPGVPVFGLLVDGDELLLNGEWLRDIVERARPDDRLLSIRIVEWDGTVLRTFCRLQRVDLVDRYVLGAHQIVFVDSPLVFPHPTYVEVDGPGEMPLSELADSRSFVPPPHRAPLQGEPHILHRSFLRPDRRFDERASDVEHEWSVGVMREHGVVLP